MTTLFAVAIILVTLLTPIASVVNAAELLTPLEEPPVASETLDLDEHPAAVDPPPAGECPIPEPEEELPNESVENTSEGSTPELDVPEEPAEIEEVSEEEPPPAIQTFAAPLDFRSGGDAVVWMEDFENTPTQSWVVDPNNNVNDTGRIMRYQGVAPNNGIPTVGDTGSPPGWGNVVNCVGIRTNYAKALPNGGGVPNTNAGYCGALSQGLWGVINNREQWWNVSRVMAHVLGSGTQENNAATYITDKAVTQSGVGAANQTPVYQTIPMDLVALQNNDDWVEDVTLSRFYSGGLQAAAVSTSILAQKPQLSLQLSSIAGSDIWVDLWPRTASNTSNYGRIDAAQGSKVAPSNWHPTPWPTNTTVRYDSYQSVHSGLFTKAQVRAMRVKVTNDNGSASGNDFAFDNITVLDVTPSLTKQYDLERVPFLSGSTAKLTFTVENTEELAEKDGWGFVEELPSGLSVTKAGQITSTCDASIVTAIEDAEEITVTGGKLGRNAQSCTITVIVKAEAPGVYKTYPLKPTDVESAGYTSSLTGLNKPVTLDSEEEAKNFAEVEYYKATATKSATVHRENEDVTVDYDTQVLPGEVITYKVLFDNTENTHDAYFGPETSTNPDWVGPAFIDYLADVLDDAYFVDNAGNESVGPAFPAPPAESDHEFDWDEQTQTIALSGTVPAGQKGSVTYRVKVKDNNSADATERLAGETRDPQGTPPTPNQVGYQLNNYLAPEGEELPETCLEDNDSCVRAQVRAWAAKKISYPTSGEEVHSFGKIYYRVHLTNISGDEFKGITITDDLTSVLSGAQWDSNPAAKSWGLYYYDKDGNELKELEGVQSNPSGNQIQIWPTFTSGVGSPNCYQDPDGTGGCDWRGGKWTLTVGPIDLPEEIDGKPVAEVVLGYVVRAGYAADPADPMNPYAVTQDENAAARVGFEYKNGMSVTNATVGSESEIVSPATCGPNADSDDLACTTSHKMASSFFHIRKHGVDGDTILEDLPGVELLIADTYEDAVDGIPSKWLCHENNNPGTCTDSSGRDPVCTPNPSYKEPGTPKSDLGAPDFGRDSETYRAIQSWNNSQVSLQSPDIKPLCGMFFPHTEEDTLGVQEITSWHVEELQGGDENATNWRGDTETQGSYWLMETKSAPGFSLYAQPQQFWVAPSKVPDTTPAAKSWDMFNYQGRLSLPVVGHGETVPANSDALTPPSGITGTDIRALCDGWCEAPVPNKLPGGNQPACICANGWNMHTFNVKASRLPLTGGTGSWCLVAAGGVLAAVVITFAVRGRRVHAGGDTT